MNHDMRVLHFVSTLNCNSGVMRTIMNYYKNVDREKIQFDFLYFIESIDSYRNEIESLGGNVYFIAKPAPNLQSMQQLRKFFQQHGAKYIWLHNHESYLTVLLYPIAKQYGIQNIAVHAHLTKYSDKKVSALRNYILCIPLRFLPIKKVACSRAAGDFLFGSVDDVYIMRNTVDVEVYAYNVEKREKVRENYHFENNFVIGHIGRFQKQKNHKFLLDVFAEFYKIHPDSRLLLVGEGPLQDEVIQVTKRFAIEDAVAFAGVQTEIVSYLSAMDVFVLPSLFEGLPMVALEAQANGLDCILSDTITEETALTDRVSFCSLNDKAAWIEWLTIAKNRKNKNREIQIDVNFANEAKRLEKYYAMCN